MKVKTIKKIACITLALTMLTSCTTKKNSDEKKDYFNPQPTDTGYEWGNVEIVGGGFVPAIIYNPSEEGLAYARTDIGGAYRRDKNSDRWIPLTDFIGPDNWNLNGIESIATDPVEPNRVYLAAGTYLGTNGAILRSDDYGENWEITELDFGLGGNEPGRGTGERLMIDPNDNSIIYFATRNAGLWKSDDYGKTFKRIDSFPVIGTVSDESKAVGLTWVEFDKSSAKKGKATQTIFVGAAQLSGETVFMSTDGGKSWTAIENQPTGRLYPIHGRVSENGNLYVTYANSNGPNNATKGAVYKYNLGTGEWKDISPNLSGSFGYSGLSIDNQDPNTIVISTLNLWAPEDNIFRSTDGGETWSAFWDTETKEKNYQLDISGSPWLDWHGEAKLGWWMACVAIDPFNSDVVTYGTGATIFSTTNLTKLGTGEKVVVEVDAQGIEETATFDIVSPPTGPQLYSIMGDIYGFRHDDVTVAPEKHYNIMTSRSLDFSMADPMFVIRTGNGEEMPLVYSKDGGDNWEFIKTVPDGVSKNSDAGTAVLSADGNTILWMPANHSTGGFITDDLGETWTVAEGLPSGSYIASDRVNADYFYGLYDGSLYVSSDKGKTFEKSQYNAPSSISAEMEAVPDVAGDVWIASGGIGLLYSQNYGKDPVVRLESVKQCSAIGFGKAENDGEYMTLYMIGETTDELGNGIYRSTDKGESWIKINDDAHQFGNITNKITGDYNVFGRVYFCSNGRGIIMGNIK